MEEPEETIFVIRKKSRPQKHKTRKIYKNTKSTIHYSKYILTISLSISVVFLLVIIIILYKQNRRLSKTKITDKSHNQKENNNQNIDYNNIPKKLFVLKEDDSSQNYDNKEEIHVTFSLDNKLIFPTLVSMVSGLENVNKDKYIIVYHLLLSFDFNTSNVRYFDSLKENYAVKLNYYIIPHMFAEARKWTAKTDAHYYKVLIPFMLPDLERIIFLDGDTLIRKDISEMFNIPFNDNYVLGFPFYMTRVMDKHGINATHYINVGCTLYNIKKIRKDHKDVDLFQFTVKHEKELKFPEQDAINYVFYPKIDFLPLKYGIYMIGSKGAFKALSRYTRSPLNLTEGYEAVEDPAIVHFSCCWPKVWSNWTKNLFKDKDICMRYQKEFYYYASKTRYYDEIYNTLFYQGKT